MSDTPTREKSLVTLLRALRVVKGLSEEGDKYYYQCFGTYSDSDDHCNKSSVTDAVCHICRRMATLPSTDWIGPTISDLGVKNDKEAEVLRSEDSS